MNSNYLAHIADRVLNRPLMVLPDKLVIISSILEGRIGIEAISPTSDVPVPDASRHFGTYEPDPASTTGAKKPYRTTADGIAVIPVIGSLVGRGGWLAAVSGIQSYENIKFSLGAAAKDAAVKAVVLDIDSPGGEAVGAFETADAVRAAAAVKPVYAVATGLCCSAAYAIACGATSIIITKSSVMGSIGVVMLHADYSHALHDRGVVPTLIHAGKRKVDGTPYKPLTDDVKASLKAEVEKFNSLFVTTVAEGRKSLTPEAILAMEAGTYIGADAVKAGLADAVGTFEGVLSKLAATVPKLSKSNAPSTSGVLLTTPTHASGIASRTPRSAEDCASLERAAGDQRLAQLVATMGAWPYENCSQEDALRVIRSAKSDLARQDQQQTYVNGLYMPDMSVRGGPLFVSPGTTPAPSAEGNHGWDDVIAEMSRQKRH